MSTKENFEVSENSPKVMHLSSKNSERDQLENSERFIENLNVEYCKTEDDEHENRALSKKQELQKIFTIATCGIALFSDGYCTNSIGAVMTILRRLYPNETSNSKAIQFISSFSFIGTVVGMISFGFISDFLGRKTGMLAATLMMIIFTILCAGAYGPGGSTSGLLTALAIYRLLLGIGLGAEYPTGSCAASEATAELKKGRRHGIFVSVTNLMIDLGFVLGAFVPFVLTCIFSEERLNVVWRLSIALGVIVPSSLLYFRIKLKDPVAFRKNAVKFTQTPYWLSLKRYWRRFLAESFIWFIYNFNAFAFGMYSSTITESIIGDKASFAQVLGWSVLINFFYLPGSIIGTLVVDKLLPKRTLALGLIIQAVIGFIMASLYVPLTKNIAAFCVVYGIFLALGEFGAGNNIGLIVSKSCASPIRGQYYAFIAAIGKCGGFAGTYAFTQLEEAFGGGIKGQRGPFFLASAFNVIAAILAIFFLPRLDQSCIEEEDSSFRQYLHNHGYDVLANFGLRSESFGSDRSKPTDQMVENKDNLLENSLHKEAVKTD